MDVCTVQASGKVNGSRDVCIPPAVVLFLGSALHTHHTSAQNLSVLSVITHIHVHVILITDGQSTEYIIHVHIQCHVFSSQEAI